MPVRFRLLCVATFALLGPVQRGYTQTKPGSGSTHSHLEQTRGEVHVSRLGRYSLSVASFDPSSLGRFGARYRLSTADQELKGEKGRKGVRKRGEKVSGRGFSCCLEFFLTPFPAGSTGSTGRSNVAKNQQAGQKVKWEMSVECRMAGTIYPGAKNR